MTTLGHAISDHLYRSEPSLVARALGMILSGCLILGWAALKLTPRQIGA